MRQASFVSQKTLEEIDLHGNMISTIEGGAFIGLSDLLTLDLGRNRLSKFNSDVFQGAENLEKLDLSENFITDFPTVALKSFVALKHLNLSSNMITVGKTFNFPQVLRYRTFGRAIKAPKVSICNFRILAKFIYINLFC